MKDLMKLVGEVKADFDTLKIRYRAVRHWAVGTKSKQQWGYCEMVGDGLFDIHIAERLLEDDMDDQYAKNTIAHELLHTVEGCLNHKWYWKKLADAVNERLPSYRIQRTLNPEEIGIHVERKEPVYRYFFRCKNCGIQLKYQRKCKFLENYKRYHCSRCGGKFEPIEKQE